MKALGVTGVLIHTRSPDPLRLSRFLIGGMAGSIVYAMFAGTLAAQMFAPPFDPYLSSGLDLRGVGFVLGGFAGGATGAGFQPPGFTGPDLDSLTGTLLRLRCGLRRDALQQGIVCLLQGARTRLGRGKPGESRR